MEKKITKKEQFARMADLLSAHPDLVEFCQHEIDLLDRKANAKTNSKVAKAKADKTETVYNALAEFTEPITATDFMVKANEALLAIVDEGESLSVQRITAYLKKLVDSGRVAKETIKKKSYFSIIRE